MKKIILLIFMAALCQSCFIEKTFVGFGLSTIFGSESWKDPVALQVGTETKVYDINDNSSLHSGLNISYQGAGWEESMMSGRVRLAYLNVPLLYNQEFKNKIFGEIGLQPGLLISAKDKYDGQTYDYMDYTSRFELGLPVGVGYHLNDQVSLGVRATHGLTSMDESGEGSDHNFMLVGRLIYTLDWSKFKK